ncbi:MAG: hypothetical protein Q7J57_16040, partial [Gemmobacter sp.]|nr:hypothetical protein [Gemmobacter sp.]
MPDQKPDRPLVLGAYQRRGEATRVTATEVFAGLLSLLWLGAVVAYFTFSEDVSPAGSDQASRYGLMLTLFVVFLPIALIWVAAVTARTIRALRDEAQRLQVAVEAMRQAYIQQQQAAAAAAVRPSVEKRLDDIVASQRQTETTIATFTSRRDA